MCSPRGWFGFLFIFGFFILVTNKVIVFVYLEQVPISSFPWVKVQLNNNKQLKYLKDFFFYKKKTQLTFVCLVLRCYQLFLVEKE